MSWKEKRIAKEAKNWTIVQNAAKVKLFRIGRFTIAIGKK